MAGASRPVAAMRAGTVAAAMAGEAAMVAEGAEVAVAAAVAEIEPPFPGTAMTGLPAPTPEPRHRF
jgi:hypothetical protein